MISNNYIDYKFFQSILLIPKIKNIENRLLFVSFSLKTEFRADSSHNQLMELDYKKYIRRLYLLKLLNEFNINLKKTAKIAGLVTVENKNEFRHSLTSADVRWSFVSLKHSYADAKEHSQEACKLVFFNCLYHSIIRPVHRNILSASMNERSNLMKETNILVQSLGFAFFPLDIFESKNTLFDPQIFEEYSKKISNDVPNRTIIDIHALGIKYKDGRIIAKPEVVVAINS